MVLLREELFKVYGKDEEIKPRAIAIQKSQTRKPASTDEVADTVELDSE